MEETTQAIKELNYKFRELRIYSSTEWLADNKKKYRQVFDRFDTTFVYVELSFYNKLFDRENWEAEVVLRCISTQRSKKEVCNLQFVRKINKYDPVIYIREGWGNKKEGAFWKKGTYFWEAYIDGEKVGTKYFYVEDAGHAFDSFSNPYFKLHSLKLYEGPYDDVNELDRTYYTVFHAEETRYIYAEATFDNLMIDRNWQFELFFKFFNEAQELKGQVVRLLEVKEDEEYIKVTAGWGANMKNTWRPGSYSVAITFMDYLVARLPFEVDYDFEEGVNPVYLPNEQNPLHLMPEENMNLTFEEVLARLDALIGLQKIKNQVREHAQYIQFVKLRREKGFEEKEGINIHSVFTGNPGTGKTTVAKMMGLLYKKMGLLTKGHVHEVDRVDLVGEYIGQTAPKVREAIEKARGGVLFIDEAYALARANDDSKDFGREVIELLVKEMSDGPGDLAVIVAGYPKEMQYFLKSNPGLRSRFKIFLDFPDYLPQELSAIADYAAREKEVTLAEDAKELIDHMITEAYRARDNSFGNARYVHDLIDKAKIQMALRVMDVQNPYLLTPAELEVVSLADVEKIKVAASRRIPNIPIDEELLASSLTALEALVGLKEVKKEILDLVNIVRYYRRLEKDVLNNFFLHTVFVGNPGTGKTTVARILTQLYKALGILEKGHMVETDRQGLVAGFIGQTAIKTAEKIDEAKGGVLFIDEAYALTASHPQSGDYGQEAIQTLLKRMEDERGVFFVFVAGYPDNMERFLKANPGLSSRFDKILKFEDYDPDELREIAIKMVHDKGLKFREDALSYLHDQFKQLHAKRDRYFGNARAVRQAILEAIKFQNLRLAAIDNPKPELLPYIELEDLKQVNLDLTQAINKQTAIGFKR
ncbi:MAG: AAA family ATPase [Lewinellaceae bacterium]|nr:AAA family ATPase [Lewinellaceae bacterium]